MTMAEMEIANLASDIVKYVMAKDGVEVRIKVAALQVAQHILGQANAIAEANKVAADPVKKPSVSGAFL